MIYPVSCFECTSEEWELQLSVGRFLYWHIVWLMLKYRINIKHTVITISFVWCSLIKWCINCILFGWENTHKSLWTNNFLEMKVCTMSWGVCIKQTFIYYLLCVLIFFKIVGSQFCFRILYIIWRQITQFVKWWPHDKKGCRFDNRQEQCVNFLLQSKLSVLTLTWCPFHPSVTAVVLKRSRIFCT